MGALARSQRDFSSEYLAENISAPLLTICICFLVLETIFIVLMYISRYIAREKKKGLVMLLLMTAGYITCTGKITLAFIMIRFGGAGRHLVALDPPTRRRQMKMSTVSQIICPFTTSLTKLGICIFLLQILGQTSRTYRIIIKTTFFATLCILLVQVTIPFGNCKPFSRNWNPKGPGSCAIPGLSLWRYLSLPNVVTSLVMICIPVPALYRLKVSRRTRLGLGLVCSVCLLGVVAGVMRAYAFLQVEDFHDISYENIAPLCWTVSESGIYLIAGVMLTLKPLIKRLTGKDDEQEKSSNWSSIRYLHGEEPRESEPSVELDWEKLEWSDVERQVPLDNQKTTPPESRAGVM